jgi:O-methyltransferase
MMGKIIKSVYSALNSALANTVGLELRRSPKKAYPRLKPHIGHERIFPLATYAPWQDDQAFNDVYAIAKDYTLVDKFRLYELYSLVSQLKDADGAFLEVGVWRGGSSAVIQKALASANRAKGRFYIADTFKGVVKAAGDKDSYYKGGEHADTDEALVRDLFAKCNLPVPDILKGIFPDDHPDVIKDAIRFLHSDVDSYQSTKDIIAWALPRLSPNAVMVFDDYGFMGCEGVTDFCNELRADPGFFFVHNLNGHAVFIKK